MLFSHWKGIQNFHNKLGPHFQNQVWNFYIFIWKLGHKLPKQISTTYIFNWRGKQSSNDKLDMVLERIWKELQECVLGYWIWLSFVKVIS
jgi:hypothetical protein